MYLIHGLTQTLESYPEEIKCLHDHYNRPRIIHREHVRSILQAPIMRTNKGKELRKLYDMCKQHIRAIKLSDEFDLETFLTIAIELKLDEATRLKWMEHSNHSQKTPPYSEVLEFLNMQARHHESVTSKHKPVKSERKPVMSERKPVTSERKSQTTTHRPYARQLVARKRAWCAGKETTH